MIINHIKPQQGKMKSIEVSAFLWVGSSMARDPQRVTALSSSPWNVLEMQILGPHSRATESGTLRVGLSCLCFDKSSTCFLRTTILWPDLRVRNFHRSPKTDVQAEVKCLCLRAYPGENQGACHIEHLGQGLSGGCEGIQRPL